MRITCNFSGHVPPIYINLLSYKAIYNSEPTFFIRMIRHRDYVQDPDSFLTAAVILAGCCFPEAAICIWQVWRSIISISSSGFCSTTWALKTNSRTICDRSTGVPGLIFKLWLALSVAVRIFRVQGFLVNVVFVRRRSSYLMSYSALCVNSGCTNGAKCDRKVLPCFQICSGPVMDLGHPWTARAIHGSPDPKRIRQLLRAQRYIDNVRAIRCRNLITINTTIHHPGLSYPPYMFYKRYACI